MKNDLWIWLDWQRPATQRVASVDDLWSALKETGDPKVPCEKNYIVFRAVLAIPRPVVGAEFTPPTQEWTHELYAEFVEWVKENRKDLYSPAKAAKGKKSEMARA